MLVKSSLLSTISGSKTFRAGSLFCFVFFFFVGSKLLRGDSFDGFVTLFLGSSGGFDVFLGGVGVGEAEEGEAVFSIAADFSDPGAGDGDGDGAGAGDGDHGSPAGLGGGGGSTA